MPQIDTASAPALVADAYARAYAGLSVVSGLDGVAVGMPALGPGDFIVRSEEGDTITLSHEPLVGIAVFARVSKVNGWVMFDGVTLASE